MDTILNLGLNDETCAGLAAATDNPRFAWDSYRRFLQMYGDVVMGVQKRHENEHEPFEEVMDHLKKEAKVQDDTELTAEHLKDLVGRFKKLIKERTGKAFPTDPMKQLEGAVFAVFGSWMNERAILNRQKYRIPDEWGTRLTYRAWCSVTWATIAPPVLRSLVTLLTAITSSTASTSLTHKVKTLWLVFVHL